MIFGEFPIEQSEGAILAHSLRLKSGRIAKGTRVNSQILKQLSEERITQITGVMLEAGDWHENAAAQHIAASILGSNLRADRPSTGRVNIFANTGGLLQVDRSGIDALNRIDPSVTLATLDEFTAVESGRLVATVKIIPFAVEALAMRAFEAGNLARLVSLTPFKLRKIGLIATTLNHLKPSVMDKTRTVTEERLVPAGAKVVKEMRVPHNITAVADGLKAMLQYDPDIIILFGASAIVDPNDVLPTALRSVGGEVVHLGMPVDPGNLLMMGNYEGHPVIGAPGCARSPKENGFDRVLNRMLAGMEVTPKDITDMGVGGLMMEIVSRPRPRVHHNMPSRQEPKVAVVLLAAGRSSRMGSLNKLLAKFDDEPLVSRMLKAGLESKASKVVVVTGHEVEAISAVLSERTDMSTFHMVHNPAFAEGISTSVSAGIRSLEPDIDAAIILLADMPAITSSRIDQLIDAYDPATGALIVTPVVNGRRGNPVLWSSRYFSELSALKGDIGAKHLIAVNTDAVIEIEMDEAAIIDVDTPAAMAAAGGQLNSTES